MIYEDFDGGVKNYLNSLRPYRSLSKKEERKLLTRYKLYNDIDARNKLVNSNLKYACKIASSFRGRGMSYLELISEANSGLIDSIDKYDMEKDVKLISYSKWWIMQRMQFAIEKRSRIPETEFPEDNKSDLDEDDINDLVPCKEENNSFEKSFEFDDGLVDRENELKTVISGLFKNLDEREGDMVNMYYGRLYGQSFTLEEIGKKYGLTKERVRQVIEKAFKKIRSEAILSDNTFLTYKN